MRVAGHARGRHAQHRRGCRFGVNTKRIAKPGLENSADVIDINRPGHRFQLAYIQAAKNHIGIEMVGRSPRTNRSPGISAGALWSDQKAGFIDPGYRTTTGPDGAHIDHRHVDRHGIFDLDLPTLKAGSHGSAPHPSRCRPCHS